VKFLLWALFIVLLVWMMRSKRQAGSEKAASTRTADGTETMRRCEQCGTYVPESEAVLDASGKVFCSEDHRLRHAG
jgi:uncharacterized protein